MKEIVKRRAFRFCEENNIQFIHVLLYPFLLHLFSIMNEQFHAINPYQNKENIFIKIAC